MRECPIDYRNRSIYSTKNCTTIHELLLTLLDWCCAHLRLYNVKGRHLPVCCKPKRTKNRRHMSNDKKCIIPIKWNELTSSFSLYHQKGELMGVLTLFTFVESEIMVKYFFLTLISCHQSKSAFFRFFSLKNYLASKFASALHGSFFVVLKMIFVISARLKKRKDRQNQGAHLLHHTVLFQLSYFVVKEEPY